MSRSAPLACTQFQASHSLLDRRAAAERGVLGNQSADEDEIVFGDHAVAVAQWFLHGAQRSGTGLRTQAPRGRENRAVAPAVQLTGTTQLKSSSLAGGTRYCYGPWMFASRRKEPPPSAHPFNRFWDIAEGVGRVLDRAPAPDPTQSALQNAQNPHES